jgi:dihydrodipicolinate reductase
MKIGRMSQKDKDFISKNANMSVKSLAKKLDRTEESIQKVLDSLTPEPKVISKTEIHHKVKNDFGRSGTAIVMTPAVASVTEDAKKKRIDKTCIFQIDSQKKSY